MKTIEPRNLRGSIFLWWILSEIICHCEEERRSNRTLQSPRLPRYARNDKSGFTFVQAII